MLILQQDEVFKILQKQLTLEHQTTNIGDLKLYVDWMQLSFDKTQDLLFMDATKYDASLISFFNGTIYEILTIGKVKELFKKEFLDSECVLINVHIRNIDQLEEIASHDEAMELIEFSIEVGFNDRTSLDRHHLDSLIDLALTLKDKEWFEFLISQKNKVKKSS